MPVLMQALEHSLWARFILVSGCAAVEEMAVASAVTSQVELASGRAAGGALKRNPLWKVAVI